MKRSYSDAAISVIMRPLCITLWRDGAIYSNGDVRSRYRCHAHMKTTCASGYLLEGWTVERLLAPTSNRQGFAEQWCSEDDTQAISDSRMNHLAAWHEYVLRNPSMSLTVAMLDVKLSLLETFYSEPAR